MEDGYFDLRAAREALVPRVSRLELARHMGVSHQFLKQVEVQFSKWPEKRRQQFDAFAVAWQSAPTPHPRKIRKDAGKKRRKRRVPKTLAEPTPVPHSHHEIVGIG